MLNKMMKILKKLTEIKTEKGSKKRETEDTDFITLCSYLHHA